MSRFMFPRDKAFILRCSAHLLGMLQFLFWSMFFMEHMEWFRDPSNLPPARIFFGWLGHLVMLFGYLAAFRNELAGSICIIGGGFILFSRVNNMGFVLFFGGALLVGLMHFFHWRGEYQKLPATKNISERHIILSTTRWLLIIASVYLAALITARWIGGEYYFFGYTADKGWHTAVSDGFPNPFAMQMEELTLLALSALIVIGLLATIPFEFAGAVSVLVLSVSFATVAHSAVWYPVLPTAPIIAVSKLIRWKLDGFPPPAGYTLYGRLRALLYQSESVTDNAR